MNAGSDQSYGSHGGKIEGYIYIHILYIYIIYKYTLYVYARKVEQKTFHTSPTPRTQIPTWLDGRVVFNLQFTRERYMCDLYVLRLLLCLCHLEKEPDQST